MHTRTGHAGQRRQNSPHILAGCIKHPSRLCHETIYSCTIATRAARHAQPCIVFTNTDDSIGLSLQELASQTGKAGKRHNEVSTPAEHHLSLNKELKLLPQPQSGVYHVAGATAADCVLCAVDGKAGLLAALGLTAALVVVGVHRGHALSADVDINPAVLVARQASQLGIPSIATCLATESSASPIQPASQATVHLIQRAINCLKSTNMSWPEPANYPRAHFPFPEQGRWALGKELPLPQQNSSTGSRVLPWHTADCWALGEDNSWAGKYHRAKQAAADSSHTDMNRSATQAANILRRAFADADIMLCINVPPTWQHSSEDNASGSTRFASTRPGVIWRCYQVEADTDTTLLPFPQQLERSDSAATVSNPSYALTSAHDGVGTHQDTDAADIGRWEAAGMRLRHSSWQTTTADLYGRSLPATSFTGSQAGAFVTQDNTDKVISWMKADTLPSTRQLPSTFKIQKGTVLTDHATAGDVEAVFDGKAAVSTLQTWPVGHPLSLRDDVLALSLEEDEEGLPLWLSMT